jgi:hypothetical protein
MASFIVRVTTRTVFASTRNGRRDHVTHHNMPAFNAQDAEMLAKALTGAFGPYADGVTLYRTATVCVRISTREGTVMVSAKDMTQFAEDAIRIVDEINTSGVKFVEEAEF